MHDAVPVRVVERGGNLAGDTHRLRDRELRLAIETIPKRLPLHVRHDVIQLAVSLAGVEHRQDVRVRQPGRELDLAKEPGTA